MNRILYFDMWSPESHQVFNSIHLNALCKLGDVYTVFKEGYMHFEYPHVYHFLDVPKKYYKNGERYSMSRIRLARMLRWVWRKVSKEKWDYIIFSSYDPLALFLSRRFKNAIVIDHNTIGLLDIKLYWFPFRHLSKNIKHIVFNDYMKSRLNMLGFENVSIVPHGFLPIACKELSFEEQKRIRVKYSINTNDRIIFLPSLSINTLDVVGECIYNEDFNRFLQERGLKLITKSPVKRNSKSNIIIIDGYLPQEEYDYLFLNSTCNVLFYSQNFKYRSSGVINECFANNIPCVFSECEALKAYLPYINNKNCIFNNTDELKRSIDSVLIFDSKIYYKDVEEIKDPFDAWKKFFIYWK